MIRILVCGPPCAGKTSLATHLAQALDAEVIDLDQIAQALGSTDTHDHPENIRRKAETEYQRRLDTIEGSAVVIRSAPLLKDRVELAKRIRADRVVVLDVPADEAKRRAAADGRPEWTPDAIDRWWQAYQPSPPEGDKPQEGQMTTEENNPGDDGDEEFDEARAKAKIAKVDAEAKSLRERLKAAEAKAAKLDELENADQSETQKLAAKLAEAERKAQEAEHRAMRAEVAASKGLTPAQAKRLVGDSLEELEADADELLESFKPQEGDNGGIPPPEGKPHAKLRGGTDPTQEPDFDLQSLLGSIPPT